MFTLYYGLIYFSFKGLRSSQETQNPVAFALDLRNLGVLPRRRMRAMPLPISIVDSAMAWVFPDGHRHLLKRYVINIRVPRKFAYNRSGVRMQTSTHSEGLVVWTEPKALDEAKSLFAP